jgi:hypothetical protein
MERHTAGNASRIGSSAKEDLTMAARLIASWLAVALLVGGPLQPLATAQTPQTAQPPQVMQPAAPPPEDIRIEQRPRRADAYDVGAGVVTVLKAPFNVVLCVLGGATGLGLFVVTLGSGYRVATRAVEEGCRGPWLVRGDDLRPEDAPANHWQGN